MNGGGDSSRFHTFPPPTHRTLGGQYGLPAALRSDGCACEKIKKGRFPRDTSAVLAVADVHFGSEQSVQGVLACTSVLARCTCRQLIEIQAGH